MMDPSHRTPLHYAAMRDDVEAIGCLLADGADPDTRDVQAFTPLHLAAQEYAVGAVRALLAAGAEPNARNRWGNGPLFTAVFNSRGRGDVITLLRSSGADALARNEAGQTPFGLARMIENYEVARYFADLDDGTASLGC